MYGENDSTSKNHALIVGEIQGAHVPRTLKMQAYLYTV